MEERIRFIEEARSDRVTMSALCFSPRFIHRQLRGSIAPHQRNYQEGEGVDIRVAKRSRSLQYERVAQ